MESTADYVPVSKFSVVHHVPVKDTMPSSFRMARLHTGEMILQGGFRVYEGCYCTGIEWEAIPTVNLDENGNVI